MQRETKRKERKKKKKKKRKRKRSSSISTSTSSRQCAGATPEPLHTYILCTGTGLVPKHGNTRPALVRLHRPLRRDRLQQGSSAPRVQVQAQASQASFLAAHVCTSYRVVPWSRGHPGDLEMQEKRVFRCRPMSRTQFKRSAYILVHLHVHGCKQPQPRCASGTSVTDEVQKADKPRQPLDRNTPAGSWCIPYLVVYCLERTPAFGEQQDTRHELLGLICKRTLTRDHDDCPELPSGDGEQSRTIAWR